MEIQHRQGRRRGAPVGNRNAVKHGFYSRELNKEDRSKLKKAANIEDISQEIALLRFEIQKATSSGEIAKLIPLSKAAYALEKLIRTQQKIFGAQNNLGLAIGNAMKNYLVPLLTPESAAGFLERHYEDKAVPLDTIKAIQKQIPPENREDLTYNKKQSPESD